MGRQIGIWGWVGILLIILLVLNIVGLALSLISKLWFWAVIAVIGYIAYYGMPRWRGGKQQNL